jgi:hypothetical protein
MNQAEDQKDSTNIARPPTYSQPAIQPLQSIKPFQPKDLWQTAYDQLDETQQQSLLRTQSSPESKDKNARSRMLIDEIIQVTERQYEAYQQKSDKTLRKASRKIIDALLSYREIICTVAGLDPTQHAASAWAVVSLGLKVCIARTLRRFSCLLSDWYRRSPKTTMTHEMHCSNHRSTWLMSLHNAPSLNTGYILQAIQIFEVMWKPQWSNFIWLFCATRDKFGMPKSLASEEISRTVSLPSLGIHSQSLRSQSKKKEIICAGGSSLVDICTMKRRLKTSFSKSMSLANH